MGDLVVARAAAAAQKRLRRDQKESRRDVITRLQVSPELASELLRPSDLFMSSPLTHHAGSGLASIVEQNEVPSGASLSRVADVLFSTKNLTLSNASVEIKSLELGVNRRSLHRDSVRLVSAAWLLDRFKRRALAEALHRSRRQVSLLSFVDSVGYDERPLPLRDATVAVEKLCPPTEFEASLPSNSVPSGQPAVPSKLFQTQQQ